MTSYFLKHPVIAFVLNAMLLVVGYLSFSQLNVREYPQVIFPEINVFTSYPNASPDLVETAITNPLEDLLSGIEGLDYIDSESKFGASYITLTFKRDTPLDRAFLLVRENLALAELPEQAKQPTIERKVESTGIPFIVLSLKSTDNDFGALTHFANLNLKNVFRSVKGAALVQIYGQPYTYEVSLDPYLMATFGVNVTDVTLAIHKNKMAMPAGKFQNTFPITLDTDLNDLDDYENLLIKNATHRTPAVLLKHVADIQLTTDDSSKVRINGKAGLCIGIQKGTDANPLEVSDQVREKLKSIKVPPSMELTLTADKADFVRASINSVKKTIFEAIVFVMLVVFFFLRNVKATLIPLLTIPISLMGGFVFLKFFGFSINILTLLAMVLAVGLVVDDAIVVLENIQRHIDDGLSAFDAAIKGTKEIAFAIVAMTLTLTSVYAPLAFIEGITGQLFIEFAVALAGSVLISGWVALTLSPYMCAKSLKPHHEATLWPKVDDYLDRITQQYVGVLSRFIEKTWISLGVISILFLSIFYLVNSLPREMAPKEDRGLIGVFIPATPGENVDDMDQKLKRLEKALPPIADASSTLLFIGNWGGNLVFPLKQDRTYSANKWLADLKKITPSVPSLTAYPWSDDTGLPGASTNVTGDITLAISSTNTFQQIYDDTVKVREVVKKTFESAEIDLRLDARKYKITLDEKTMNYLNIHEELVAKTVEIFFTHDKSQSFVKDGILYPITIKSKYPLWDINELYIQTPKGKSVSLGAFADFILDSGPSSLRHYNQMRTCSFSTNPLPGVSFEESMAQFYDQIRENLPSEYRLTWTGAALNFLQAKSAMLFLFMLSILFIYAILCIQFESFKDPLIILITVPLACFGALFLTALFGGSMNIYTQVGLITLIGLISKHGILIIEFFNQLRATLPVKEAMLTACERRLRPILMTTAAMLFGAVPLLLSRSCGYEARQAIGFVLFGGLFFGTFFTLFILPSIGYAAQCGRKAWLKKV